jgi:hypothetical protein
MHQKRLLPTHWAQPRNLGKLSRTPGEDHRPGHDADGTDCLFLAERTAELLVAPDVDDAAGRLAAAVPHARLDPEMEEAVVGGGDDAPVQELRPISGRLAPALEPDLGGRDAVGEAEIVAVGLAPQRAPVAVVDDQHAAAHARKADRGRESRRPAADDRAVDLAL